jgi:hypothetical protein
MPVSSKLIKRIFDWGTKCSVDDDCENKLKALIAEWPRGEKPSQLVSPDSQFGEGKLGTVVARSGHDTNYQLLVHVHNADNIGRTIDPEKKWGKLFGMGGIPGIGIASRLSRGLSNTGSAVASGVGTAAYCTATLGKGRGCVFEYGGRRTRRRKNKKNKNKKSRRRH